MVSAREGNWKTLLSAIKISEKHVFLNYIFIQILMDPTASCSCHSVRISSALWRRRKDSPIPASTSHYGSPVATTRPRRANTWTDWRTICTMTFRGITPFTSDLMLQCRFSLWCNKFKVVFHWISFPSMFSPELYPLVSLSSLSSSQSVTGLLALYALALKSSCYDLNTVTFTVAERSETLLTHLKKQMELEKEHIACKFPFECFKANARHKKCSTSSLYTVLQTEFKVYHVGICPLKENLKTSACWISSYLNVIWFLFLSFLLSRSQPTPFDQLLPVLSWRARSLRERHQGQQPCQPQAHQGSRTWAVQTRRCWECRWVKPASVIDVIQWMTCRKDADGDASQLTFLVGPSTYVPH